MPFGQEMTSGQHVPPENCAVALEHLERRREPDRPSGREMVVGVRASQLVHQPHVLGQIVGVTVEELVLVDGAIRRAFTRGAVVRGIEDDGVVELPRLLQVINDAADLRVGVFRESGEDLGHVREQLLLVCVQGIPRADMVGRVGLRLRQRVDRRELRVLRQHAFLDHARQHPGAVGIIAVVELALVFVDVFLRGVVRGVVGTRVVEHEPRFRRVGDLLVANHPDGLIGQVLGEVVALLGRGRRLDEVIVLDEVRIPLIGLATEESVEALESLPERPGLAVAALGDIRLRNIVILAQPEGAEAAFLQDLCDGAGLRRDTAAPTGKPVGCLRDCGHAVQGVVAPVRSVDRVGEQSAQV